MGRFPARRGRGASRCKVVQIYGLKHIAMQHDLDQAGRSTPTRISANLTPEQYETLRVIAEQKKVSIAWVIRDAVEKYIADRWPLLKGEEV